MAAFNVSTQVTVQLATPASSLTELVMTAKLLVVQDSSRIQRTTPAIHVPLTVILAMGQEIV